MALPHARSGDIIELRPLGTALSGNRTTALIKSEQLELVRIVLAAGQSLREHSVAGEITLLCLEGEIEFRTDASTKTLRAGELIHLAAGAPHALQARTEASALLTICLPAG